MGFLRRLGIARRFGEGGQLQHSCPHLLAKATYTFGTTDRDLPEVRLDLTFTPRTTTLHPAIAPVLLVDRGNAFPPTADGQQVVDRFAATPSYFATVPSAILRPLCAIGAACQLAFFDNEVSFAEPIHDASAYMAAFLAHPPRGSSSQPLTAVRDTVQHLGAGRGLYLLVFTNGLRGDTLGLLFDQFGPGALGQSPYPRYVHLVDTGDGMSLAEHHLVLPEYTQPGASTLYYQRAYRLDSREKRLDPALVDQALIQLEHVLVGAGTAITVEEVAITPGGGTLLRVANRNSNLWHDGPRCTIGFVPLYARLGLEFAKVHPPATEIVIRYFDGQEHQEIPLRVPLPDPVR